MNNIQKKVLSETNLYYGMVEMPEGFEIDQEKLSSNILQSNLQQKNLKFSIPWDMLNTYLIEHIRLKYNLNLCNKETFGNIFFPNEKTSLLLQVNKVDLRNSPDYVLLYGVNAKDCSVIFYYDDNRRKGKSWEIELTTNKFIMFPSICTYQIINKNSLNIVQTITYEYI